MHLTNFSIIPKEFKQTIRLQFNHQYALILSNGIHNNIYI